MVNMGKTLSERFILFSKKKPSEYDLVVWKDYKGKTCTGWMQNGKPKGRELGFLKGELSWRRYCHIET